MPVPSAGSSCGSSVCPQGNIAAGSAPGHLDLPTQFLPDLRWEGVPGTAHEEPLERIEQGEYGVCLRCGEEIDPKRMHVRPFSRYCVECKTEVEKFGE